MEGQKVGWKPVTAITRQEPSVVTVDPPKNQHCAIRPNLAMADSLTPSSAVELPAHPQRSSPPAAVRHDTKSLVLAQPMLLTG